MNRIVFALSLCLLVASAFAQEEPNPATTPVKAASTTPPPDKPATPKPPQTKAQTDRKVILTDGVRSIVRMTSEIGLAPTADAAALKGALTRLAPQFAQPAKNAKPYGYKGQILIHPGAFSRALNVPATAERMLSALKEKPEAATFTLILDKKPPVLTAERLKGIDGVLASVTTTAWVAEGRNKNVRLGVGRIDGTLLSPGEVFSLNQIVGQRTAESGFQEAPIFVDGKKVPGLGGGISQVTGTTFNAAAKAGLPILEAHLHSRTVAYLPVGQDATVVWGQKDMRFQNNTGAPIYVAMNFANQKLTATLYGKKTPGQTVTLKPVVQRLGPGKINAQLYRTIKINGKVTAKELLLKHAYRWTPE